MAIILKNAPKTEEGRRLNLTKEQEEEYRIVFRLPCSSSYLAMASSTSSFLKAVVPQAWTDAN